MADCKLHRFILQFESVPPVQVSVLYFVYLDFVMPNKMKLKALLKGKAVIAFKIEIQWTDFFFQF